MKKRQNYENRLLRLAQHLATEQLQWVDMDSFKKPQVNTPPSIQLGPDKVTIVTYHWVTIQLPYLWPQHFAFKPDSFFVVAFNGLEILEAIMEFFNLTADEMFHLWVPTEQEPEVYGGRVLGFDAQPNDLADLIIQFVSRKMSLTIARNKKNQIS